MKKKCNSTVQLPFYLYYFLINELMNVLINLELPANYYRSNYKVCEIVLYNVKHTRSLTPFCV